MSEYVVLCRIFRNSSGRRSKKPGRNASNGHPPYKDEGRSRCPVRQWSGVAKEPGILCGQAHFLEKFGVSGVAVQLFEQWIAFDLRESGVALVIGILEPFK